jgi:hypothetical protein
VQKIEIARKTQVWTALRDDVHIPLYILLGHASDGITAKREPMLGYFSAVTSSAVRSRIFVPPLPVEENRPSAASAGFVNSQQER